MLLLFLVVITTFGGVLVALQVIGHGHHQRWYRLWLIVFWFTVPLLLIAGLGTMVSNQIRVQPITEFYYLYQACRDKKSAEQCSSQQLSFNSQDYTVGEYNTWLSIMRSKQDHWWSGLFMGHVPDELKFLPDDVDNTQR